MVTEASHVQLSVGRRRVTISFFAGVNTSDFTLHRFLTPSLDIVLSPHRTQIFQFGAVKAR